MKTTIVVASLALFAAPLAAQYATPPNQELPRSVALGAALHYGSPQGEFASNVNAAFGANGFAAWQLGNSGVFLRADLGYSIYGSETRRMPLGRGALGLVNVDVNTTNNILNGGIGLQVGHPGRNVNPYVGGSIGFSYFFTESSVSGASQSASEAFASSTNDSDGTFAKTLFGGFYIPVGSSGGAIDLGLRYHWNGEARYLTSDGITFDANENPVLHAHRTRADLLTFQVGFAFKRR